MSVLAYGGFTAIWLAIPHRQLPYILTSKGNATPNIYHFSSKSRMSTSLTQNCVSATVDMLLACIGPLHVHVHVLKLQQGMFQVWGHCQPLPLPSNGPDGKTQWRVPQMVMMNYMYIITPHLATWAQSWTNEKSIWNQLQRCPNLITIEFPPHNTHLGLGASPTSS